MPPALSAPAIPRKIVQSAPSIFSQMRRAVARLRPWNETRSIRESTSSALKPGSAANGSTGTRRKRDFCSMTHSILSCFHVIQSRAIQRDPDD